MHVRYNHYLIICMLFLYGGLSPSALAQSKKRVLFLGNSYTAVNGLPGLLANMALSAGDTVISVSYAPGGYTLQDHAFNNTSLSRIRSGSWDFVVLQEQSQLPSFPIEQVTAEVFPYARYLDSVIKAHNSCAQTIFYMTWGRKNGDAQNCAGWPPVCTYLGMDSLLRMRYLMMAENNHALVSPVGAVWRYIRHYFPHINLYSSDNSHPSAAGSYAAACAFYSSIFRKDPTAITNDFSLNAADAANIRAAARAVVFDSLITWNIGRYDSRADFNFVAQGNRRVQFTNQSSETDNFVWYFGDGDSSLERNPLHLYRQGGNYFVTLQTRNCFSADTIMKQVLACPPGFPGCDTVSSFSVYPNPVRDRLTVTVPVTGHLFVLNALGQVMRPPVEVTPGKLDIDMTGWPANMYIIVYDGEGRRQKIKVIKR